MAEERFKTTLMGGFDKDDVLNQVREMKDAAYAEKSKLIKEKKEQEKQIQELKKQLAKKSTGRTRSTRQNRDYQRVRKGKTIWLTKKLRGWLVTMRSCNPFAWVARQC